MGFILKEDKYITVGFFLQNDFSKYRIDWGGPVPAPSRKSVNVPDTRCPIDPVRLHSLSLFYPPHNASAI